MLKESLSGRGRRNLMLSLLVAAFALTGGGMAQAQSSAPVAPAKFGTVYTGDVINGKKVVSSLNTADLAPGKNTCCTFRACRCPPGSTGMCR